MKVRLLIVILLIVSCKKSPSIADISTLDEISYEEMLQQASSNTLIVRDDVVYIDENNNVLSNEEKESRNEDLMYAKWLVNEQNELVMVQLQSRENALKWLSDRPVIKDNSQIDCNQLDMLLERIYRRDQENRSSQAILPKVDSLNLVAIEAVIDKCGMPTIENSGEMGPSAVWLVIQHASADKRKKYFPMLLEASKKGDLDRQDIALMQDRMLMDAGKPQLYGSQVTVDESGEYVLYDLRDPETVDQRRAVMNLMPLKEYLNFFEIEFNVPQK